MYTHIHIYTYVCLLLVITIFRLIMYIRVKLSDLFTVNNYEKYFSDNTICDLDHCEITVYPMDNHLSINKFAILYFVRCSMMTSKGRRCLNGYKWLLKSRFVYLY